MYIHTCTWTYTSITKSVLQIIIIYLLSISKTSKIVKYNASATTIKLTSFNGPYNFICFMKFEKMP